MTQSETIRLEQFLALQALKREQTLEELRRENAQLRFILETERKTRPWGLRQSATAC